MPYNDSGGPQTVRLVTASLYPGWEFVRWAGCDSVNGTMCDLDVPIAGPDRTVDPRAIFKDVAAPRVTAFTVLPTGTSEGRHTATWGADELGVSFKCAIDNGAEASCASGYTFTLAEGKHSLRVIPEDRSGNVGGGAEVKLNVVDTVLDEGPAEGAYVATWRFAAHTGVGTAMECSLDAGAWFACGGASGPLTLPALADGQHTLRVRGVLNGAVDRYPAIRTWVVDTTAPDTMFNDFRITANEPVAGFRCRLDGVNVACSTILPSTPGTHTFEVAASDHAGNVDPTPANAHVDGAGPRGTDGVRAHAGRSAVGGEARPARAPLQLRARPADAAGCERAGRLQADRQAAGQARDRDDGPQARRQEVAARDQDHRPRRRPGEDRHPALKSSAICRHRV